MFIKLTKSAGRTYAQLVESFRDESGKVRQRTVATLGRADESLGQVDALLNGLLRARGRAPCADAPQVRFDSALALGDVWALSALWRELGFDRLAGVFRRGRYTSPVEHAVRVMVFNRLCNPDSKLGVLRWLQTVSLPDVDVAALTHQHLLRAMDALTNAQDAVDACVDGLLRPLLDTELALVFYDLTTIRAAGLSEQAGELRQYGKSKEGGIARQVMLGLVQTADGLPIYHQVFEGNTSEGQTFIPMLKALLARFTQIQRLIVVADRGLLSLDNLEQLQAVTLPNGKPLEYILAVAGRRYGDFVDLLAPMQFDATKETLSETQWQGQRLVLAHDPQKAREQQQQRLARIATLEQRAVQLTAKLDAQDAGQKAKGRKLSDSGAKARFFHEVCEARLAHIIKVDMESDLFSYTIDDAVLQRQRVVDGKLLLVTNVPADLKPQDIITRYKALADIERGFRVLKSDIEIAPMHHRLADRIRAHAAICFIALILQRVMRQRLRAAQSGYSPEAALQQIKRVQRHRIQIDKQTPMTGVSTLSQEQRDIFQALNIPQPA